MKQRTITVFNMNAEHPATVRIGNADDAYDDGGMPSGYVNEADLASEQRMCSDPADLFMEQDEDAGWYHRVDPASKARLDALIDQFNAGRH